MTSADTHDMRKYFIISDKSILATVQRLDWLKPDETVEKEYTNKTVNGDVCKMTTFEEYDVILGSDIVYERTLILPLCKILKKYLYNDKKDTCKKVAYIACTERSYTTLECFEVTSLS